MEVKEYKWDISMLQEMKRYFEKVEKEERLEFLKLINEMEALASGKKIDEKYNIIEKLENIFFNYYYRIKNIDSEQSLYLKILEQKVNQEIPELKTKKTEFSVHDIMELFEEFLVWFPSPKIGNILKHYYLEQFTSHFYYCQNQKVLPALGCTYKMNPFYSPFIIVTENNFAETFITLIHEIGHALFQLLEIELKKNKSGRLFSEIEGRYFELLAIQFLKEKKVNEREVISSKITSYNSIKTMLKSVKISLLWKTFFSDEMTEENLCEIYSYLGSLELINRYHGDYEKQLYDLIWLAGIAEDDMSNYLSQAKFRWRENEFQNLEKQKKKIKEERNIILK